MPSKLKTQHAMEKFVFHMAMTAIRGQRKFFTVFVNFHCAENAIKQIDVYRMMIKFEPLVVLAWGDDRENRDV